MTVASWRELGFVASLVLALVAVAFVVRHVEILLRKGRAKMKVKAQWSSVEQYEDETSLQSKLIEWLKAGGHYAERTNTGGVRRRGRYIQFNEPGHFDVTGWTRRRGVHIEVETKSGGRKLSDDQQTRYKELKNRNAVAVVAREFDSAVEELKYLINIADGEI